jgi:hypothetical protein
MGQRYSWDGAAKSVRIGYPTGYKYMLAMTTALNKMPDLKFPETETAMLISDDSLMFNRKGYDAFKRAFIAVGEQLCGWFKFVSDTHLHRKEESLDKYKIVYIPYASYLKKETFSLLEQFVRNGGTVICGDPQFADYNIHGDKVDWLRQGFGGIKWQKSDAPKCKLSSGIEVNAFKSFSVGKTDKVLAKYADGKAALVEKKFGKGKIIISGFNLFNFENNKLDGLIAKLHKENGGSTGHKIWNFKFPEPKIPEFRPKEGKCLTGNYGYWDRHKFFAGAFQNAALKWTCTVVKNGKPAASAKLFDRLNYFKMQKDFQKGSVNKWIENFPAGRNSIVLKTGKTADISEVVLYYAGECSNFTVETSADGKMWKKVSAPSALKATKNEVKYLSVACPGKYKQILLNFTVPAGKKFAAVEAEVWKN